MIISENILVKINPSNFKRFKNLKYKFEKVGDIIYLDIKHLSIGSHVKVLCKCINCNEIKNINYCNYIKQTKNSDYYCKSCKNIKTINTCNKLYGCDNPSQLENIKNKKIETHLKNYGVKYTFQSHINILKREKTLLKKYNVIHNSQMDSVKKKKKQFLDSEIEGWKLYKRLVRRFTKMNIKLLYSKWNGFDYYDNEYIKENKDFKKQPTIDHKISIFYGFKNNISVEEISSINNLCLTKRSTNSSKNIKCEKDFLKLNLIYNNIKK